MAQRPRRPEGAGPPAASDLLAFPRPSVAVDVAVLTVTPGADAAGGGRPVLGVLVLRRPTDPDRGEWGLPGSFVRERETLGDAVLRTLADKCGIGGLRPRQLGVFDDPHRDDRGWVMSVAHVDVVPLDRLAGALGGRDDLCLAPVAPGPRGARRGRDPGVVLDLPDGQRNLPFDHDRIVERAVGDLRDRYRSAPDPDGLVDEPFTLLQLRRVHEAVLGDELQKDTFRRQVLADLRELDRVAEGTVGRPARLYRRASRG